MDVVMMDIKQHFETRFKEPDFMRHILEGVSFNKLNGDDEWEALESPF